MSPWTWQRGTVVLGRYEVLDAIHSGNMGIVYRVRHREWNADLAVKIPRADLVATLDGRRAFEAEAGIWATLDLHPHLVSCAYVRRIDELPCVFAEWVDGGSLDVLVQEGRLYLDDHRTTLSRVLDVAVQIAWGIGHAHRQGVIHYDIKPANIMIDAQWTAKVTDFGLAKARAAAGERADVPPGASLVASYGGRTPAYCSPEQEQAAAGEDMLLTQATDVWSWALCVLEMFVGKRPWRLGHTAAGVFTEIVESGPAGSCRLPIPPGVVELLRQCLRRSPTARPRSDDAAAALAEIYSEVVGVPYPRPRPAGAALLAGGASNRALSLLDLDRPSEAEQAWLRALEADPHHAEAVYNWSLYRWRRGRLTDEEVLSALETARAVQGDGWRADHLIGLVHLERGDDGAARELLAAAPRTVEITAALTALAGRPPPRLPVRLPGHRGKVTALAMTSDGGVALSGGDDGRIRVWAMPDDGCVAQLAGDGGPVTAVAITDDGRIGLAAHGAGPVEVWDIAGGACLRRLTFDAGEVCSVAINGAGTAAVTAHRDGIIKVWDVETGTLVRDLVDGHAPLTDIALSDDGRIAVSASTQDGSVAVWDLTEARVVHRRLGISPDRVVPLIDRIVLARDGSHALLDHWNGPMQVWDPRTDRVLSTTLRHLPRYCPAALTVDGAIAVTAEEGFPESRLRVWETRTGRCVRTIDAAFLGDTLRGHQGGGQR